MNIIQSIESVSCHKGINPSSVFKDDPAVDPATEIYKSTGWLPEYRYSVEMEVNSNGNIIDGINHCYAFGKVNDETIFSDNDFPCPTFSSPYSNPNYNISNDELPFLGGTYDPMWAMPGVDTTGTVRIRNFEWLEGVTMPPWLEEVPPSITTTTAATTTTIGESLLTE